MKRLVYILIFTILSGNAWSQPAILWEKALGGSGIDNAYSIIQTLDGGYIVAGTSNSNDSQVTGNHGAYDYWIAKLNDTGAIQWEKSMGGSGDETSYMIRQTADSGYIIAGGTTSSDGDVTCSVPEWDYWLVKITPAGSILWNNCFGGSGYNVAWSVQQTPDLGFIAAGVTYSTDGEVTGNHGSADYWVIKVSALGALVWEKCLGGSLTDLGKCVQPTTDGGYIVAGSSNSNDGQVTGNHGGDDYWVVKLNDTGAIQWQKSLGGRGDDEGKFIRPTFDGGYIVVGGSNSNDGDVTGHHGDSTTYDMWAVKLNDTGGIEWEKSLGGAGNEWAYAVQQTLDSGYIIAGSCDSNNGDVTGNHGTDDFWVVQLDKNGNLLWQKSMGGSMIDVANSVEQTTDSGYILAGQSISADGEITGNHGDYDYWVVKLASWVSPLKSAEVSINETPITVMPNPTTGQIRIAGKGRVNIFVYNLFGQQVKEAKETDQVSISELPIGVYLLKITDKDGAILYESKIVKQ